MNNIISNTARAAASLLLATLMLSAAPLTAWADNEPVSYIDADGTTKTCTDYTVLTSGSATTLSTPGWYVATGSVSYTGTVTLGADVKLILTDGCRVDIGTSESSINGNGIVCNGTTETLTIYGQSTGSGMLSVYTTGDNNAGISANTVTINGGTVSATATGTGAHAIYAKDNFCYYGGNVTANGNGYAIRADGKYTFAWRNVADRIAIGSTGLYAADGKTANFTNAMTDGSSLFSGTVTDLTTLSGKTLQPHWAGSGNTEESPYIISRPQELDLLAYRVNGTHGETADEYGFSGKYFRLDANIAYTATTAWDEATSTENNYEAIGCSYGSTDRIFKGIFDGAGHTISGIRIYCSGSGNADNYQGIFGRTNGANIHDFCLADARITGNDFIGGIVGNSVISTITNCHVANNVCIHAVTSSADNHGGIVGYNDKGTVESCTSATILTIATDVTGCLNYGVIAGENYFGGTLSDNLAIGATVPAADGYGAIVGTNRGTLTRNYYTACTVAGLPNATGKGCHNGDLTTDDGAVPALRDQADVTYALELMAKLPADTYPASFQRTFTAGKASTLCLPFAMSSIEGGKVYQLRDVTYKDGEWVATMIDKSPEAGNKLTDTEAGKPYLFMPSTSEPVNFAGEFTVTDGFALTDANGTDGWTMKGTYQRLAYGTEPLTGTIFGFASKDKTVDGTDVKAGEFVRAKEGAAVPAFRAYLTYSGDDTVLQARAMNRVAAALPQTITVRLLGKDGSVTAIGTLATDTGELNFDTDDWYTLGGHKLGAKPATRGIYIHKGQKVVIK